MSLKTRLDRIENAIPTDSQRIILVRALDALDVSPAGTILPWETDPNHRTMTVPAEFETDPLAGLTVYQKAFLKPDDRVIVLQLVPTDEVIEKIQREGV